MEPCWAMLHRILPADQPLKASIIILTRTMSREKATERRARSDLIRKESRCEVDGSVGI
ncbi:protein of unknown function [Candidatus Nitrospira inopinata]|uniref:Uncharacterized protein n=1 Tax=Candidatus Nitrospira inopinata TaxID=1715989 RepID=A0A0S4KTZ5_9BACT|nr:protein of unknown function [Candidatus Nitrospira inopinata]